MSVQRVLVVKCKVEVDSPDCTSTLFYCDMLIKKLFIFTNIYTVRHKLSIAQIVSLKMKEAFQS